MTEVELLIGVPAKSALFFFQAEDGIRHGHVTGVQTCALPICFQRVPDPVCLRSAPPGPHIPAPLHDGNRRIGTVPPANQCRQRLAQHRFPLPTVASRAGPACPSEVLRTAKQKVHALSWCAVPGYHSREPAALPEPYVLEAGSQSLTCLHRRSPGAQTCALV